MHLKISSAKMAAILSRSQCVNGTSTGPSLVQFRYISAGTGIAVSVMASQNTEIWLFVQQLVHANKKKKSSKVNIDGHLWGESTRRWWIPLTRGGGGGGGGGGDSDTESVSTLWRQHNMT